MTKEISWGFIDTPVDGVTELTLDRPVLNFSQDFRIKTEKPGEVVLTNLTTPLDRPESIRIATSDIKDIYSSTNIDPSVYAPSKRGVSILAQLTDTLSVSDTTDPEFRVDLPVSAHLVIRVPANEYMSADKVQILVSRLVSSLYETGKDDTTRIDGLLRGALVPRDV